MTSKPEWFDYRSLETPNAGWVFAVRPRMPEHDLDPCPTCEICVVCDEEYDHGK